MRQLSILAALSLLPCLWAIAVPVQAAEDASAPAASAEEDPFVGLLKPYKTCRAKYAEMDARVDAAGVRDGGYYRVPGFPYFRTDRLLASFANEVQALQDVAGWTRRMREFDQEARETEYINLGLSPEQRAQWRYDLLACGGGLASIELFKPDNLERLRKVVAPMAEYTDTAAPGKPNAARQKSIEAHQAALMQAFAAPLPAARADAPLRLWRVKPVEDLSLVAQGYGRVIYDELGVPGLIDSQWRALAEIHAPALWIETESERDQPGTPAWSGDRAVVDAAQPRINYQVSFMRFGSARLAQINYFIWFKGRTGTEAGIDGLIWRVTLDNEARPLVYDVVHASGRDHLWFPAQALTRRDAAHDGALFPQPAPIAGPVALRLQAGSHALIRVVAADAADGDAAQFQLARYEDLFTLPKADGVTRNLFGADGLIPGAPQQDFAWLWGQRISKPGALRELGRIPVSYLGQTHFDDADLIEKLFVVPGHDQATAHAPLTTAANP